VRLEVTPLVVELGGADAANDFRRLVPRVDRDPRVAALLRTVEDAMETARGVETIVELRLLDSDLLHAQHVGALTTEPAEEALARGAAQSVRVEADDSQGKCRPGSNPKDAV